MSISDNPFMAGTPLHDVAATLLARPIPPIMPQGPWSAEVSERLRALSDAEASANVRAGLHLMNDDLGSAHVLVQPRENDNTSSYWHGIVHRREGDWNNAKYWMRRTGYHPLHDALYAEALGGAAGADAFVGEWESWDAIRFVDLCREASGGRGEVEAVTALQWLEMGRLLQWCVAHGG